jgi:CHAT domain-containing protein
VTSINIEESKKVTFDEFRLVIQPDIHNPNDWSIDVRKCSMDSLMDSQRTSTSKVSPADLNILRNPTNVPNIVELRRIGQAVLDSIMPADVQLGLKHCMAEALKNQRGLRLVISLIGDARSATGIKLHELPLEAVFNNKLDFIATNVRTPVSRGVTVEPDREPFKVAPPLRILVVASEPADMPPVNAAAEKAAILTALKPMIDARAVVVDFCEPPTLMQLDKKLRDVYHVVHFIGHGDFEIAGMDPNPQPHLYFEDGTANRFRSAADVEQIYTVLRNGNVPLVVLTACSTAAAAPNGTDYPVVAFESLAQALVERHSGPSAAVAMQFDFETQAAEIFSRTLYERLLTPGWSLDEAIAATRVALITKFGPGHRSWVNPTVYWRFKEGRVFELLDTTGSLTLEQQKELSGIDARIEEYESILNQLSHAPKSEQEATEGLRQQWQEKIQEFLVRRGLVLGDTIRLRGGLAKPDGSIECAMTLQLRLPATVGDVRVTVQHDLAEFDIIDDAPGRDVLPDSVFVQRNPGKPIVVLVQNASQGAEWSSGEHELAKLKFRLKDPTSKPMFYIQLVEAKVNRNGASQDYKMLNAVVFGR